MSLNEILMSLEMGLIYGIVALGVYLTFRIIDFPDLTCDGSFVAGAATSGALIKLGFNPWLSLLVASLVGGIAGATTAMLYVRFKVTNLLAGILVGFMLYSINLRIMGGIPNISLITNESIFSQNIITKLLAISFVIVAAITYLLNTDFGLALRCLGQNIKLAQNSGVNVSLVTIICLALSNALIAFGGGLFSQHQGFADIGSGVGTVIIGFASVMIGERLLPYRSIAIKIVSCLLGSIIYRFFISLALHSDLLGFTTSDLNLITGIMIICIMYFPKRQPC